MAVKKKKARGYVGDMKRGKKVKKLLMVNKKRY